MFIAMLAAATLSAAASRAHPSGNERLMVEPEGRNIKVPKSGALASSCNGAVTDALARIREKDGGGLQGHSWEPKKYPDAGYFFTLDKHVAGCQVAVPVARPENKAATSKSAKPLETEMVKITPAR